MLSLLLSLAFQDPLADELLRVQVYPGAWAQALSAADQREIRREDVRKVACVGQVGTHMVCSWEQRIDGVWATYYQVGDVSQAERPRLSPGERRREAISER
ncbi:hypothetical protein [Caulobacter mirabilis]|uniref:Uncharacterized protein n=1 Tax=Caulobacter mirabilis TaxID=69666 RepID=A0A2D2B1R1_9CAUL|nr:hypothetical protein [Caulobacter mirabilis]ATQ44205.1 hypothetical protein CSW64_18340 [Caulobacter mirabilis]